MLTVNREGDENLVTSATIIRWTVAGRFVRLGRGRRSTMEFPAILAKAVRRCGKIRRFRGRPYRLKDSGLTLCRSRTLASVPNLQVLRPERGIHVDPIDCPSGVVPTRRRRVGIFAFSQIGVPQRRRDCRLQGTPPCNPEWNPACGKRSTIFFPLR